MPGNQHDSAADWPTSYDPYTDDGKTDSPQVANDSGKVSPLDVKDAGTNTDTRDGALGYGNSKPWAPRVT